MLNFSALPTDAAAVSMRFEPDVSAGISTSEWLVLKPVVVRKEWVYPRDDGRSDANNAQPVYKTVRISEHRWPLPKSTFMCSQVACFNEPNDGWPVPPPPMTRADLVHSELLMPWQCYPNPAGETYLPLDDKARCAREFDMGFGSTAPNDGLPDDYLEFWASSETQRTEGAAQ